MRDTSEKHLKDFKGVTWDLQNSKTVHQTRRSQENIPKKETKKTLSWPSGISSVWTVSASKKSNCQPR